MGFALASPAFASGGDIPALFTCEGQEIPKDTVPFTLLGDLDPIARREAELEVPNASIAIFLSKRFSRVISWVSTRSVN